MSRLLNFELNKLAPYTPGEQPQNTQFIKLNTNENPYPPSPKVEQAVRQEIDRLHLYSDPACRMLLAPMAKAFGVEEEQVFAGNGSDEILAFCFQAFCQNGAAFPDLTYGFYPVYAQLYGVDTEIIPLNDRLEVTPSDYFGIGRTMFLANPNAPTGQAITLCDIEDILRANPDQLLVVDEAYVDFGANTAIPLISRYDNLLVVGTFSKSRSLAGGRVGYAVGNNELIADLNRIKYSFNPYNLNRMSMAAAAAAVEDTEYFEECREKVMNTRAYVLGRLREMEFMCTDSLANFVFVKHASQPGEFLYRQLREQGILVRRFNLPRIEEYLRISIGTREQMERMLDVLESIV